MARFIDSLDLFGRSPGVSTCGDFTCAICGTEYNKGNDDTESYDGDSVLYTDFAGACICGDCFEGVEKEILHRMPDIISWYCRILKTKEETIKKQKEQLKDIFLSVHK